MLDVRNYPHGDASAVAASGEVFGPQLRNKETGLFCGFRVDGSAIALNPSPVQAPARPEAAVRSVFRYWSVSSRDTTSAYFAFKSSRLWS